MALGSRQTTKSLGTVPDWATTLEAMQYRNFHSSRCRWTVAQGTLCPIGCLVRNLVVVADLMKVETEKMNLAEGKAFPPRKHPRAKTDKEGGLYS